MTLTHYKAYHKLLAAGELPLRQLGKTLVQHAHFQDLLARQVLEKITGKRGAWRIRVAKPVAFARFFHSTFGPVQPDLRLTTRAANATILGNSKATKVKRGPIFLLRGFSTITLNGACCDLKAVTARFGLCGVYQPRFTHSHICFVENLEPFQQAEQLLGTHYLYLHRYGRLGASAFAAEAITAQHVCVFVDWDYEGLDMYLGIKARFPQAELYLPDDFEALHRDSNKPIKDQRITKRLAACTEPKVVQVRTLVSHTGRFLEQERLFH